MAQDDFWSEIDFQLEQKSQFFPEQLSKEEMGAEQTAYVENLTALAPIVQHWAEHLQKRGFTIHAHTVAANGMKLAFTHRGFHGFAGCASWRNVRGNLIAASVGPESLKQLHWPADPAQAVHLGRGFSTEKLTEFLKNNLLTFLDDSNLILTNATWEKLRRARFADLLKEYESLKTEANRQSAGLALERLLDRLFTLEDLTPRGSFRVTGEQIDGALELDHEIYLVEAKWEKDPTDAKELYAFREKIEGKSRSTRGVFITINGITAEAEKAITCGKESLFFVVDGAELEQILTEGASLPQHLRSRYRDFCERGRILRTSTPSDHSAHLARIKQDHPRAYERWTKEEDSELIRLAKSSTPLAELTKRFQRQPSAIRSRLRKLGSLETNVPRNPPTEMHASPPR